MQIYLVGGAVRDELLGLPVGDRDWVVVGGSASAMLAQDFKQVGKDFPVFLHPVSKEEYALARTERKTAAGYYGFTCDTAASVTLEEDLQRRDLTINAIAKAADGQIIDPYNGRRDLADRVLRHVSPAFAEDPVRILRIARFAARLAPMGFTVAPATMALMREMVAANEVDHLVPERVWQEMVRALAEVKPTEFFQVLRDCHALARIFPELAALWGVPQNPKCHPEVDTGIHIMMALDEASALTASAKIRFAVLCHDVGKALTPADQLPNHPGHEEASANIIAKWCKQYRVPNDFKQLAVHFARWHMHSHSIFKYQAEDIVQLFNALDLFRHSKMLEEFLLAALSDHKGRLGTRDLPYPQADFLRQAFAAAEQVDSQDLIHQGFSGQALGQAITNARVNAVDNFCRSWSAD